MATSQNHLFQGIHVFGELHGVVPEDLNDAEHLEKLLIAGIAESGATLCGIQKKSFSPSGVTLLALLSESHASIHTYPQEGSLFFDAFTCGTECQPMLIANALIQGLSPSRHRLEKVLRGDFSDQDRNVVLSSAASSSL